MMAFGEHLKANIISLIGGTSIQQDLQLLDNGGLWRLKMSVFWWLTKRMKCYRKTSNRSFMNVIGICLMTLRYLVIIISQSIDHRWNGLLYFHRWNVSMFLMEKMHWFSCVALSLSLWWIGNVFFSVTLWWTKMDKMQIFPVIIRWTLILSFCHFWLCFRWTDCADFSDDVPGDIGSLS